MMMYNIIKYHMFFIDKYGLDLSNRWESNGVYKHNHHTFHIKDLEKLKVMSEDESIPHIIFCGPQGCGKKSVIGAFLEMIYNKEVRNLQSRTYTVVGSGNSVHEVVVQQSNYHIVIEPNSNNFDRYLVQDVVNEYAKRGPLNMFTSKKSFKTVLINNIDSMSYYAQTSLRRTMEKYSDTCRFIMWSRSLSKVIDPLRSRCYCFKLEAPSDDDMLEMLLKVSAQEKINMGPGDYQKILNKASGNIKTALWFLQLKQLGESIETTYDKIMNIIIKKILTVNLRSMISIRDLLYRIMITNISGTTIIKDITDRLLNHSEVSFKCKLDLVELAAKFEHNIIRGRREIMHLEALVAEIMKLFYLDKINSTKDDKKAICL